MSILVYSIGIPFVAGLLCFFVPKKLSILKSMIALAAVIATAAINIKVFMMKPVVMKLGGKLLLNADNLAGFVLAAVPIFALMTLIYSFGYFKNENSGENFYAQFLMTLGASIGAVLANNLVLLVGFWGFLGFTLFLMVYKKGDEESAAISKKTLIIVGGTDSFMVLGIAIIYFLRNTFYINEISLDFSVALSVAAYVLIASAAFAKAGAVPFHTWIPDVSRNAPLPAVAYLPASLDKLLGIYLLARCSMDIFQMTKGIGLLLMIIGSATVIIGVMMALIQHDLKSLLGYHAVSQVGYMILGIGTATPVGIIGGLFHMFNNAVYKSSLFFTSGVLEKQAGTTDLDKLGGLARSLPVSFTVCLISSLAIAGVPPLNGFFSKWMIYQGIIETGKNASVFSDNLWILWLTAAVFGSALTLASFLKVIHAVFLGRDSGLGKINEAPTLMLIPMVLLAGLCVAAGIWAYKFLGVFITPVLKNVAYPGIWSPGLATVLIIIGLLIGSVLYLLGSIKGIRRDTSYYGGEELPLESRITGTDFYKSIQDMSLIKFMYAKAEAKWFDIYDAGRSILFGLGAFLQKFHNGILHLYVSWCLLGIIFVLLYMALAK